MILEVSQKKGNDRLMNKTILMGRLCADPDVRYTTGDKAICVARYRLAVNRMYSKDGEQQEQESPYGPAGDDGFMNIPDNIDEELPFS